MNRIDLEKLLEEISPEKPSGEEINLFELEKKSRPETDQEGEILSEPKWRDVQNSAVELLHDTHDLRIAVILTRALMDTQGLAGFLDGIKLIRGFIEQYWDSVYPMLDADDNNDPTERITALWELSDYKRSIDPIKKIPLCRSTKMGKYSLRDIHIANGTLKHVSNNKGDEKEEDNSPKIDVIDAAFMDSETAELREIQTAAAKAVDEIHQLDALLVEKVGPDDSVPFNDLTKTLMDIEKVLADHIGEIPFDEPPDKPLNDDETASGDDSPATQPSAPRPVIPVAITNRRDVIRMLDRICEYYIDNEPTSPVPLLLKRAKSLVDKNFLEILADMLPAGVEQVQSLFGGVEPENEPSEEKES